MSEDKYLPFGRNVPENHLSSLARKDHTIEIGNINKLCRLVENIINDFCTHQVQSEF